MLQAIAPYWGMFRDVVVPPIDRVNGALAVACMGGGVYIALALPGSIALKVMRAVQNIWLCGVEAGTSSLLADPRTILVLGAAAYLDFLTWDDGRYNPISPVFYMGGAILSIASGSFIRGAVGLE